MKQVLKVKIHQPEANYRVPFSYQRRFTYPIPPFSTVKGLLCNLMGIRDETDERFKKIRDGLSLAIYGKYESIVKEYVWFRNLSSKSHKERFGSVKNRSISGIPQHPGGQMPVTVDVLSNVNLIIYFYHNEFEFLNEIKSAFENPSGRLTTIHLGRAEDWVVFEEITILELIPKPASAIPYFTWIPEKEFVESYFINEEYDEFFKRIDGNLFRIPSVYIINSGRRVFTEYVTAKLFEGGSFKRVEFYYDETENIPVIPSKLKRGVSK